MMLLAVIVLKNGYPYEYKLYQEDWLVGWLVGVDPIVISCTQWLNRSGLSFVVESNAL